MVARIVTGLALFALLMGILFLSGIWLDIMVLLFGLLAVYEINDAFAHVVKPYRWSGFVMLISGMIAVSFLGVAGALYALAMNVVLLFSVSVARQNLDMNKLGYTLFVLIYPVMPLLFLTVINHFSVLAVSKAALLLAFICSIGADVFAFAIGTAFGKHKFVPRVSPKKSIEGAIGGFVSSVALSVVLYYVFQSTALAGTVSLMHCIFVGLLCGVFTQVGDLIASAIKRFCGIKDFGFIFPGHGGALDRIDGILLSCVVTALYFILLLGAV